MEELVEETDRGEGEVEGEVGVEEEEVGVIVVTGKKGIVGEEGRVEGKVEEMEEKVCGEEVLRETGWGEEVEGEEVEEGRGKKVVVEGKVMMVARSLVGAGPS